jgi:hypothetical protein
MIKAKVGKNSTPSQTKEKVGGRKKGTPNKDTTWIFELCQKHDFDPLEVLILVAKNEWQALGYSEGTIESIGYQGSVSVEPLISIKDRIDASKTLVGFMYPKRKSVEIKDESGNAIKPIVLSYSEESLKKAANDEPS